MTRKVFKKDPSDVLDYSVDWASDNWLGTDTIASVSWTVPSGLTQVSTSNTTTIGTIWLSGGTADTDYEVACKITTAGGREAERSITLQVRQR